MGCTLSIIYCIIMDMLAHTMRMFIVGLRVGEEGKGEERRGDEFGIG